MRPTRRNVVLAGLAAAAAIAAPVFLRRMEDEVRRTVRMHFGPRIARSPATQAFADDLARLMAAQNPDLDLRRKLRFFFFAPLSSAIREQRDALATSILQEYLLATTAVRAWETGGEVHYLGILDVQFGACQNPYGAQWL